LLLAGPGTGPLIADKAYDALTLRHALAAQGREAVIPPKANAVNPAQYDGELYKERNWIERAFGRLKDYRRLATRYDKLARNFAAAIALVATRLWFMI
jgi:putative transposase